VFLAAERYRHEVVAGDTPASVAAALASQLNADSYVSASASGAEIHLEFAPEAGGLQLDAGGATSLPATITVRGTPRVGVMVAATLGTTRHDYRVKNGDTTESIASALASLLNADTQADATADGSTINVTLASGQTSVSLSVEVSVPLSATVTAPAGLRAITPAQHFTPGIATASNDVRAALGETLPVVPGTIALAGTVEPGQTLTVTLADVPYAYTTVEGDTLQTVATRIAEVISADPNVAATANTSSAANPTISLTLKDPNFSTPVGFLTTVTPADATLFALSTSAETTESTQVAVSFAGPVKGFAGLYQVNFTVPTDAPDNPATKLTIFQNLIVFGSVTQFDIFSNRVTFPVKKE
ncbi:MAG TPA: hypothetical protein VNN17_02705, partial [Terriglobia bacterium]|nr:hypothetical protein [Terriglobia bacterium]